MLTVNSINVRADVDRVFALAADIDRWPELLPHYRWIRRIWQSGDTCVVEMAARRGPLPVKWVSVQQLCRAKRRIYYKHTDGLTRGMWVEWAFIPSSDGVRVTITHEMNLSKPVVRTRLGKWIVGEFFVKRIADRTLRHIKILAEARRHE